MSSAVAMGRERSLSSSTTTSTALSIPLFSSVGLFPFLIYCWAASKIALVRTVDVVVPSPASTLVLADACLTICAAAFSTGSSRSTNFATVTPSLVIIGILPFSCKITFRPLGPRVDATLSAKTLTPFKILLCSSSLEEKCFDMKTSLSFIYYKH